MVERVLQWFPVVAMVMCLGLVLVAHWAAMEPSQSTRAQALKPGVTKLYP
jgi:hypothetical protein